MSSSESCGFTTLISKEELGNASSVEACLYYFDFHILNNCQSKEKRRKNEGKLKNHISKCFFKRLVVNLINLSFYLGTSNQIRVVLHLRPSKLFSLVCEIATSRQTKIAFFICQEVVIKVLHQSKRYRNINLVDFLPVKHRWMLFMNFRRMVLSE